MSAKVDYSIVCAEERLSIVHDMPGVTRDIISAEVDEITCF